MDYEKWYDHIKKTRIDKSHNGIKIYKHLLLLLMLKRGKDNWFKPITPEEVALPFYRILTGDKRLRELCFSNDSNIKYWYHYDENYFTHNIKSNPMKSWGRYGLPINDKFSFNLKIPIEDREKVHKKTLEECINRIKNELGFEIDTRIDLCEEYDYYNDLSDKFIVAENYNNEYLKKILIKGKFKNRLFENHHNCLVCGIENKELLTVSYIKPWRESNKLERIDVNNGLILCPNHAKLFEKGFISFDDDGNLILSSLLKQYNDNKKILLDVDLSIDFKPDNYKYIKYHREKVFIK